MIKKCKVIARNAINMVIVYDGIEVQMPTDGTCDNDIYVKKINNTFILSSEDEFVKNIKTNQKKKSEAELANVGRATDKFLEKE